MIFVAPEVALLRGFGVPTGPLEEAVDSISRAAPFRQLRTPGGRPMSAQQTNCGDCGWYSDSAGYRYETFDPLTGHPWPPMPEAFRHLAVDAARRAGYAHYDPDTCLLNRYVDGARMGAHRDADERDFTQPIVSVTLGAAATFLWYGEARKGSPVRIRLEPGDVLVWGRSARLGYHGVQPPEGGTRFNLTFRRAR
ncbi:MAG: alpha-ketoglutarate-dependent dioxygenase AlkB [Steroidobacteraceae bacterium]|jgi:alkylated DNA repair protein (DNA oxidative demethylase)